VDAVSREAELEAVTHALLLTRYDDFNALAACELRIELGHARVYRVAPDPREGDLAAPPGEAGIVANERLTFAELQRRLGSGARLVVIDVNGRPLGDPAVEVPLFVISASGEVRVVTGDAAPNACPGDRIVVLR